MSDSNPEKKDGRMRRLMNSADRERHDVEGFWQSSPGAITAVVIVAIIAVVLVLQNLL